MSFFKIDHQQIKAEFIPLDPQDQIHLRQVLRTQPGDSIDLTDDQGNFFKGIVVFREDEVGVSHLSLVSQGSPPYPIRVYLSLLKKDKMEWVVQKLTELNVEGLYLIRTQHSVRQEISDNQARRLYKITEEAQKQSERGFPLDLNLEMDWTQALASSTQRKNLFCAERGEGRFSFKELMSARLDSVSYSLWIGPEGGWHPSELEAAHQAGFHFIQLNPLILRAETAAIAAVSMLEAFF